MINPAEREWMVQLRRGLITSIRADQAMARALESNLGRRDPDQQDWDRAFHTWLVTRLASDNALARAIEATLHMETLERRTPTPPEASLPTR